MKKLSYLNHIDALRAIAVLLVILFHLDIHLFKGGFIGVDVFFVISGFLITRILKNEFSETGKVDFKNFYLKRIRRLIPTLYLVIFLTFILTFLAFSPSDFMNATNSMFKSSIAISNFHFLGESDYFDTASNFKPLLHTWSLAIEEQFYLLYPITLFLLMRLFSKKKNGVIISLLVLFFLSLFYTFYTSKFGVSVRFHDLFLPKDDSSIGLSSMQFYLLPFRMFEFLTGGIIALIVVNKLKSEYLKLILNIIGLSLIIASAIVLSKNTLYLSTLNLLPCIGAGILLYFPPSKYLSLLFENKFLKHIGKISYTLYLIHWLIIVIYRYIFDGEFNSFEQIGLFILMILLSSVIYKYYETPLRYTSATYSIKTNTSLIIYLIAGILSIYAIKLIVNNNDGWLWRLDDKNIELIERFGNTKDYNKNNWGAAGYRPGWVGKTPEKGTEPDMIWIGDSHAAHYLYGLDNVLVKEHNKKIYISDWITTLKLPDIIRNDEDGYAKKSKEHFAANLKLIQKHKKSIIAMSHSWMGGLDRGEILNQKTGKYEKFPKDSTKFLLLVQKIEKFHKMIGEDRKLLIFGSCSPRTGTNKLNFVEKLLRPKYITKNATSLIPTSSTYKINKFESELNSYFLKYFSKSKNIIFINPADAFCENGLCLEFNGSEIYFSDASHLSKDGSLRAVKYMKNQLLEIIEEK
ncbi:MAG: acyltransferase [Flavobacteriaceae bacterium]|nr:acyltransferase [Flavobacteriaceae bacterium]